MPARQITSVALWVRDLPSTAHFYRLLGLEVPDPAGDPLGDPTFLVFPNGLAFGVGTGAAVRAYNPVRPEPSGGSPVMLEVGYDDPGEVDDMHSTVVGAGHRSQVAPFDAPWGVRFAVVEDPDGNAVGLTAHR